MTSPTVATTTPATDAPTHSTGSPTTLGEMLLSVAARHHGVALQYRRNGTTVSISYPELGARVTEIARGLIALGVQAGDRVSIFATTSAEWTLADFGALCAGAALAPVYHTSSAEECAYVLAHSGATRRLLRRRRPGGQGRARPRAVPQPQARDHARWWRRG